MSDWLDENMDLLDAVAADLNPRDVADTGRPGLTVESVLRPLCQHDVRHLHQ